VVRWGELFGLFHRRARLWRTFLGTGTWNQE